MRQWKSLTTTTFQNRDMATVEQDIANLKTDTAELRNLLRVLGEEIREFRANVDAAQANWEQRWAKLEQEREKERREMNKKWGELANKMGTLVEDIVAPNIPRIARELFGIDKIVDFSVRRIIYHPTDKSRLKDFDALLIASDAIVLNETKSTVRQSYIEEFIAFIPTVFEYLPEHKGKRVIPVFSSLYIPEHFVRYLTANKIYAMAMGDETMEILNYNDIPKP
jgi:Sec-independent protein translocase protein TatA